MQGPYTNISAYVSPGFSPATDAMSVFSTGAS